MAEEHHEQGTMDITVQQKTFDGFITLASRGAMICILVLIFLALVNA
jgi:hypothetical protein